MSWDVKYLPEALDDLRKLDGSQKILIRKVVIVIGAREDEQVYEIAQKRISKHNSPAKT